MKKYNIYDSVYGVLQHKAECDTLEETKKIFKELYEDSYDMRVFEGIDNITYLMHK